MKARCFLVLFALLFGMQSVSAWGNQTYIYACDEAVKYVWGSEVLEGCVYNQTMHFQRQFCDVILLYLGLDAYDKCVAEETIVHPAVMPALFFNDQEYHRDYTSCPIRSDNDARYLCSREKENPALERALIWFEIAEDAPDVCTRVYEFCVGSNYMADTFNPLNHLLYGVDQGSCAEILDRKIENRIIEQSPAGWSVFQVCSFRYMEPKVGGSIPKRYAQQFGVSNKTFVNLIENITSYAGDISQLPYRIKTTTTLPTTTIITTTTPTTTARATTTLPATATSTTLPEKSDEASCLPALFVILVLAAIAIYGFNLNARKTLHLKKTEKKVDRSPRKHQIKSLQTEEEGEDMLASDKGHSKLRDAVTEVRSEEETEA